MWIIQLKKLNKFIMKEIKKIYKKNWDYSLYDLDGEKIITIMFFASFIDYPRSFYLINEELNLDYDDLSTLAEKIRFHYEDYKEREIVPPIVD
jgi:hypothetical protein